MEKDVKLRPEHLISSLVLGLFFRLCQHESDRGGGRHGGDTCRADGNFRARRRAKSRAGIISGALLKGSARVKGSGRGREVSEDFSGSISFYVSESERDDRGTLAATDGKTQTKAIMEGFLHGLQIYRENRL